MRDLKAHFGLGYAEDAAVTEQLDGDQAEALGNAIWKAIVRIAAVFARTGFPSADLESGNRDSPGERVAPDVDLDALRETSRAVADGLVRAGERLVDDGELPPDDLIEAAATLRAAVESAVEALGGDRDDSSFKQLETLVQRSMKVHPERAVVEALTQIGVADGSASEEVLGVRRLAGELLSAIDGDGEVSADSLSALRFVYAMVMDATALSTAEQNEGMRALLAVGLAPALVLPPLVRRLHLHDARGSNQVPGALVEPMPSAEDGLSAEIDVSTVEVDERDVENFPGPDPTPEALDEESTVAPGETDGATADAPEPPSAASVDDAEPKADPESEDLAGHIHATTAGDGECDQQDPSAIEFDDPAADDAEPVAGPLDDLVAAALDAGDVSIAYWIALAANGSLKQFTVESLRAAGLAESLGPDRDETAEELEDALSHALDPDGHPGPANLLVLAAALRGALVSPYGIATTVLREVGRLVGPMTPALSAIACTLADRAQAGELAELGTSAFARQATDLERQIEADQQLARGAQQRWPKETHRYLPVGQIWRRWSTGSGPMARLLTSVADTQLDHLDLVEQLVRDWGTEKLVARQIDDAFSDLRRHHRDQLEASARQWLQERVARVVTLARAWAHHARDLQRLRQQHRGADVGELRSALSRASGEVRVELGELQAGPNRLSRSSWNLRRRSRCDGQAVASVAVSSVVVSGRCVALPSRSRSTAIASLARSA